MVAHLWWYADPLSPHQLKTTKTNPLTKLSGSTHAGDKCGYSWHYKTMTDPYRDLLLVFIHPGSTVKLNFIIMSLTKD